MLTSNYKWFVPDCELNSTKVLVSDIDAVVGSVSAGLVSLGSSTSTFQEAVLVGGTVDVANLDILASNVITFNRSAAGGTLGNLSYVITEGVKITFNSDSALDTSTVVYQIH